MYVGARFALIPNILMFFVWAAGVVVVATRPTRAQWRMLALAGFGLFALAALINLTPQILFVADLRTGTYFRMQWLFAVIGLASTLLQLCAAGLLIAAMISGRPRTVSGQPPGSAGV